MKMQRKILLAVLLLGLALLLVGCDSPGDKALIEDFIESWMKSKQMHYADEEGNVDLVGIWNIGKRIVTGKSGDEETDAVLDAYQMIDQMHKADTLMDEGYDQRDADKMDQAIEMRPGDWTYRVARSGLALEQGDIDLYNEQFDAAQDGISDGQTLWFLNESIDEFEAVDTRYGGEHRLPQSQCIELYGRLADLYNSRAELTGSDQDRARANTARVQKEACR